MNVDALRFHLSDDELINQSERRRDWRNSEGVTHTTEFFAEPPSWSFDVTDLAACAAFFGAAAENRGGAMLSMETTRSGPCEVLKGVFKYRAPAPYRLRAYCVGMLWVPFASCHFQITIEAMEGDTTGMRESMVTSMLATGHANWPQAADDEFYDGMFPSHPLSKVRGRLRDIVRTIQIAPGAEALRPFRCT